MGHACALVIRNVREAGPAVPVCLARQMGQSAYRRAIQNAVTMYVALAVIAAAETSAWLLAQMIAATALPARTRRNVRGMANIALKPTPWIAGRIFAIPALNAAAAMSV